MSLGGIVNTPVTVTTLAQQIQSYATAYTIIEANPWPSVTSLQAFADAVGISGPLMGLSVRGEAAALQYLQSTENADAREIVALTDPVETQAHRLRHALASFDPIVASPTHTHEHHSAHALTLAASIGHV